MKLAVEKPVSELSPEERSLLFERSPSGEAELSAAVRELLDEVRGDGDAALLRMARDFDDVELDALEVPRARWDEALRTLDPAVRDALARAAGNIRAFHTAQLPTDVELEVESGVRLGRRSVPLPAVGVYVPGGRAAYPSSVLMGVVPARAAGVPEIVVCSPPGPSGEPPAEVLAACAIGGATRLFAIGGAGAIAALTWGTESVPAVEAVVGPGNRWVTEAKRQVAGRLRIDSPAGPSELLVVAGPEADPERIAAELVAQAEHDPDAAVAAVSWDEALVARLRGVLEARVTSAPRREIVEEALAARGALLVARDRSEALAFAEAYAAEHLSLFVTNPREALATQTTAGTVFLGDSASVAFGDYLTGANHVLPTGGRSRSFSGLSTLDFLRFFTWQEVTEEGAAGLVEDLVTLAAAEGLPGHAEAGRSAGAPSSDAPGSRGGAA